MNLDDVIAHIKRVHAERVNAVQLGGADVRQALEKYQKAAEEDCLNDLLIKIGLLPPDTPKAAEDAALELLRAVEALPELRSTTPLVPPSAPPAPPTEPAPSSTMPPAASAPTRARPKGSNLDPSQPLAVAMAPFPTLLKDNRPILIFGGFSVVEKMVTMRRRTGLPFEWVSNERSNRGDGECRSVAERIRSGQYAGVILLNELMSHSQSETLVQACRASGTLFSIGKKAGTGALNSALALFERQLTAAQVPEEGT